MALPPAFKTDESFLEKIAMGAIATNSTFTDLSSQGHEPMELERGSTSFKIWKAIKIKRVRVPDILCLRCGRRVESRGKSDLEITMSHSTSDPERGWDHGLDDDDVVALVPCVKTGAGPLEWKANRPVQYLRVFDLRRSFAAHEVVARRPKGAGEGFELRVSWPAAVAKADAAVEDVNAKTIRLRKDTGRAGSVRLVRGKLKLAALVKPGDRVERFQIVASVVPVTTSFPCVGGADTAAYIRRSHSVALSDRYTAVKALSRSHGEDATAALIERMQDEREHVYVRVDAAAGLLRRGHPESLAFFEARLQDEYLPHRLEAVIVLGEVGTPEATRLLIQTLRDGAQHAEIRAGAAWALGEVGAREALPVLVESFAALETVIKVEAARGLAKLARLHLVDVLGVLPSGTPEQRSGIAWALSKAGGFRVDQLLPALVDEDARHWVTYVIGTQDKETILPEIEALARRDPEVYFAVTVLWKILSSWVYGLEEH
jgi:hypothetical protein